MCIQITRTSHDTTTERNISYTSHVSQSLTGMERIKESSERIKQQKGVGGGGGGGGGGGAVP